MTTVHVTPPMICADCVNVLHSRIPPDVRACNLIYPCRHQPGGVIVATVFVVDGAIQEWLISGPMDETKATVAAAQFLEANRAAGGRVQDFTARRASLYN